MQAHIVDIAPRKYTLNCVSARRARAYNMYCHICAFFFFFFYRYIDGERKSRRRDWTRIRSECEIFKVACQIFHLLHLRERYHETFSSGWKFLKLNFNSNKCEEMETLWRKFPRVWQTRILSSSLWKSHRSDIHSLIHSFVRSCFASRSSR